MQEILSYTLLMFKHPFEVNTVYREEEEGDELSKETLLLMQGEKVLK